MVNWLISIGGGPLSEENWRRRGGRRRGGKEGNFDRDVKTNKNIGDVVKKIKR